MKTLFYFLIFLMFGGSVRAGEPDKKGGEVVLKQIDASRLHILNWATLEFLEQKQFIRISPFKAAEPFFMKVQGVSGEEAKIWVAMPSYDQKMPGFVPVPLFGDLLDKLLRMDPSLKKNTVVAFPVADTERGHWEFVKIGFDDKGKLSDVFHVDSSTYLKSCVVHLWKVLKKSAANRQLVRESVIQQELEKKIPGVKVNHIARGKQSDLDTNSCGFYVNGEIYSLLWENYCCSVQESDPDDDAFSFSIIQDPLASSAEGSDSDGGSVGSGGSTASSSDRPIFQPWIKERLDKISHEKNYGEAHPKYDIRNDI